MKGSLGEAVAGFDDALGRFRTALSGDPVLYDSVFADSDAWTSLLTYKLVPHLAGEGCLVVALTGGTNSGKSTVFNLLVGKHVSPVRTEAAATRHPVLAANARRARECLDGKLVPEFEPAPFDTPDLATAEAGPDEALYVVEVDHLPDRMVVLDTPDVDSIERANWTLADNIRAAGDVLVAVITPEKYKDERVVDFFRTAHASGRVVVPVINKANPEDGYAAARRQLETFCTDVGLNATCFALPHDFALAEACSAPISNIDGGPDLAEYLDTMDVPAIKERVYQATVTHFAEEAGAFLDHAAETGAVLRAVVDEFRTRAASLAAAYDPAPGAEVGGLFHSFVQQKRGPVRRLIGAAGSAVAKTTGALAGKLTAALRRRASLEPTDPAESEREIRAQHALVIERITHDLATSFVDSARNLREPARRLLEAPLKVLDIEAVVDAVAAQTLQTESVSDAFRAHAFRTLETWWQDHKGRRRVLETLDTLLATVPTAIAAPLSFYAGGIGVPETVAVAGPFVEQFVARVLEYQFGDAMFDFLSPWRIEQQQALTNALVDHLADPVLVRVLAALEPFEGPIMDDLRRWQSQCLTAS